MSYVEQLSNLLECDSEQEWRQTVFDMGKGLGFEQTLLAIFPDKKAPVEASFAFLHSNYSSDWRNKYDAENLGYVDPTVTHCTTKTTPLIWSPELFSSRRQKEMYEEACGYNLKSGVTLPIHGPNGEFGLLCFVSDNRSGKEFLRHTDHKMPELSYLRDFIFESSVKFRTPLSKSREELLPELTRCELECLKWSAAGKSSWEIATILHCSEPTVNFHIGNVRRKLNVSTRREAVVKAIRLGIIYPT